MQGRYATQLDTCVVSWCVIRLSFSLRRALWQQFLLSQPWMLRVLFSDIKREKKRRRGQSKLRAKEKLDENMGCQLKRQKLMEKVRFSRLLFTTVAMEQVAKKMMKKKRRSQKSHATLYALRATAHLIISIRCQHNPFRFLVSLRKCMLTVFSTRKQFNCRLRSPPKFYSHWPNSVLSNAGVKQFVK